MPKKILKTREQFTSTLSKSLIKDLRNHSAATRIPMSKLLDMAVETLLEKNGK